MFRSTKPKLGDKARFKQACSTAVSHLQTTLRIVEEATGSAGLPRLKTNIGGLLDVIKKTSQNAEDIERLSKQIEDLNRILESLKDEGTPFSVAIDRMDHLFAASNTALEELRKMASRNAIKRFIYADDARSISSHIRTITRSIQNLTVESTLAIEFALDEHAIKILEDINSLRETTMKVNYEIGSLRKTSPGGFERISGRFDMKDDHPPFAMLSPFNSKDRVGCLEGTRTDVLDQIFHWIGLGDSHPQGGALWKRKSKDTNNNVADASIFWINGSAGTGKTTIAYAVAEACQKSGVLGASFFCSRDDAECSNPRLIFTSIAHQFGNFNASFRAELTRAVTSHHDIGYATPSTQLEMLIVKPLQTLGSSFPPCVVVLDALDECQETWTTSTILSSLSRHVDELFPLKFLVTSRPENHITTVFGSSELNPVTHRYILHEVELGVVHRDIELYLSRKLASTRVLYHLENEWPSIADIQALTRMSSGLFIFASMSVRFIEDRNYCDPKHQLGRLLCNVPTATEPSSPDYTLDRLYSQVLNDAFPNVTSHLSGRLKMVLGTIVLLRDPLSPLALERLLGLPPHMVRAILHHLHSVIMVPDDDTRVTRTIHPSILDFLTNPTRCQNPKFIVNPPTQHTLLARACLTSMMVELKRDICGIKNPSLLNNEVDDLPTRVMTFIPPHLQYACRHWAWHLENAILSDNLLDLVKNICLKYLLYWLEALSLMGDLRNGLLALGVAQRAIALTDRNMSDSILLLDDCERFTREFSFIISTSSLQVYHSALLFTPRETSIKTTFARELDLPMKTYNALDETWSSCVQTMEGHSDWVKSVTFSPDGMCIASGSDDKTLRLWDAVTGAPLTTLEGHSDWIRSVAFSPDTMHIVSGSDDCTLRLWDAVCGAHLHTFEGHSGSVYSVTFGPDGARIVSGSDDCTLRLWDAVSGAHLDTFRGHSASVRSVAISPDGSRIVSGSDDCTLRLWDAVCGAHLSTFKGHSGSVYSVAFGPDGARIVSGSEDCSIRLWDAVSGSHLNTFKSHSRIVFSVASSPDGARLVSGSEDCTLRLWDTASGAHLNTFKGHSSSVHSVAFSPDGTRIVSGSVDRTLRLWDALSGVYLNAVTGHSSPVRSVTFSPDGTRIVSGSDDCTLRLWDAVSGAHVNTFKGHSSSIRSVAFSPDGTHIASGSDDCTLRLWDAVSGALLATLEGHSSYVSLVAFAPNGKRIVSGSYDKTLRLWDTDSAALLNILEGHSSYVNLAVFSPDGMRIVSGSGDNTLRLWDTVSGTLLTILEGHLRYVSSAAFSPDSTRIVSGSYDSTLRVWDAVSGEHLSTLVGPSSSVLSVAFSPDGMSIVSGSSDNTLGIWHAVSGAHLKTIKDHFCGARSAAQSYSFDDSHQTSLIFGYIAEDGWVHSIRNRRICWLPVSCRPITLDTNRDRVALGTVNGRVLILDLSGMGSYFYGC